MKIFIKTLLVLLWSLVFLGCEAKTTVNNIDINLIKLGPINSDLETFKEEVEDYSLPFESHVCATKSILPSLYIARLDMSAGKQLVINNNHGNLLNISKQNSVAMPEFSFFIKEAQKNIEKNTELTEYLTKQGSGESSFNSLVKESSLIVFAQENLELVQQLKEDGFFVEVMRSNNKPKELKRIISESLCKETENSIVNVSFIDNGEVQTKIVIPIEQPKKQENNKPNIENKPNKIDTTTIKKELPKKVEPKSVERYTLTVNTLKGAKITLNGKNFKNGSKKEKGTYRIGIYKKGYYPSEERMIDLTSDGSTEFIGLTKIPVQAPVTYSLIVNTVPYDARVQVMDIDPPYYDGIKLSRGSHDIRVSKSGYRTKRFPVNLTRNRILNITLERNYVPIPNPPSPPIRVEKNYSLGFTVNPPDTRIYFRGGSLFSNASRLPEGRYTFDFRRSGYENKSIQVNLNRNQHVRVYMNRSISSCQSKLNEIKRLKVVDKVEAGKKLLQFKKNGCSSYELQEYEKIKRN